MKGRSIMVRTTHLKRVVTAVCLGFHMYAASAKDIYYLMELQELTFTGTPLPTHQVRDETVDDLQRNMRQLKEQFMQPYVRIRPAEQIRAQSNVVRELALYYVVTPTALTFSLSESIIKRAIDRQSLPEQTEITPSKAQPWLGENMAVRVKGSGLVLAQTLFDHNAAHILRQRSWGNLVILNEWQRRFNHTSPVALHRRLWQTKLVCTGGREYVWNEKLKSMESTVFGCPGQPQTPAHLSNSLTSLKDIRMGVTFEEKGLRARAEIKR
ncbi:hypothetical protein ACFL6U_20725 [Planctomycetota bacterium]